MGLSLKRLDGANSDLPDSALQSFKSAFRGSILAPADAGYDEVRKIWNGMIDRRPGLIVRCSGTADVVQAVRFAREHGLLLSVRGGGHNIAGLAVCEGGLMIDMSLLRGVWADPKQGTVRAQAGCTLGDVDRETQVHGQATVLGFVSLTGIAGLTTGGGFGYLTRRFGWTCDNVLSMEVVTADARIVRAAPDENADLFWALRGGSGNFGIVTSFEYKAYPVGPEIVGGAIAWRGEDMRQVLEAYAGFTARAPRELTCVCVLRIAPPAPWLPADVHGKPVALVFVCYTGAPSDADALLKPLRALGQPVADIVTRRPYTQMQALLDATQPKGRRYYWKSHWFAGLPAPAMATLAEHAMRAPSPHSGIVLFHVQGAPGELPADHSPMGNRDAAFALNIQSAWDSPGDDARNVQWARDGFESTARFSTGGVYVNFLSEDEGSDRIEAAYGRATLQRLADIKQRWDPGNLFRHNKPVSG